MDVTALLEPARALVRRHGGRAVLGITGAPGAGKSTLAMRLVAALAPDAVAVPMDGFHLANAELERLGRRDRKGAPDTFDAAGYAALLRRLHDPTEPLVYAPSFDRVREEPTAGAIPIPASVPLVVTEGNYLLVDDGPWKPVAGLLDEVWYVEAAEEQRLARLIERHVEFGRPPDIARDWALGSDARNAEIIAATRSRADRIVGN